MIDPNFAFVLHIDGVSVTRVCSAQQYCVNVGAKSVFATEDRSHAIRVAQALAKRIAAKKRIRLVA